MVGGKIAIYHFPQNFEVQGGYIWGYEAIVDVFAPLFRIEAVEGRAKIIDGLGIYIHKGLGQFPVADGIDFQIEITGNHAWNCHFTGEICKHPAALGLTTVTEAEMSVDKTECSA